MERYQEAFLFSSTGKAVEIEEKSGSAFAVFDSTIFYPGGGGQPCDTGKVFNNSFEAEVISVSKQSEKIVHELKVVRGKLSIGDIVTHEVDRERREALIRMHTGEHMLYKSIENLTKDLSLVKIDLDESESSLFVSCDMLDWNILFAAEKNVNAFIRENRKINILELSKEEASKLKELRIKLERIKTSTVRVINIEGFDYSACTGTHAPTTGFIGNLFITKFAVNHGTYEIRYKTNVSDFSEYLNPIRKITSALGCDITNAPALVEKIMSERDLFKENYRKALEKVPVEFNIEYKKGIVFKSVVVEGFERKKIIDTINLEQKEKTIVLIINKDNDKANVFLSCSPDLNINLSEKLKAALDKFGGKGGGKDNFAQGSVDIKYAEHIKEEIIKTF